MSLFKFAFKHCLRAAFSMAVFIFVLIPVEVLAQHHLEQHAIEEVFVTGAFPKTAAETALPIKALSGEALRRALQGTLGETLDEQPGVHSASFGPGVGLPVIRGQSGPRVAVLQNGLSSLDAAASSQDHASGLDPLIVERVEIIRGPATLLYGNGAIGGVVNVIDNRIPDAVPSALTGAIEVRHESAASAESLVTKLDGGSGHFAWHLDAATRDAGVTEIPGFAVNEDAVSHAHEDHATETHGHDEHEEHHDETAGSTYGFIANSDSRRHSYAVGGSWVGERGFAGLSISRLESEYGLPPGSHLHGEDEHDQHEAPAHEEGHAKHSDVRIDLRQTRYNAEAGIDTDGFFHRFNTRLVFNDYQHTEFLSDPLHAGEVASENHSNTRFTNRGFEGRFTGQYSRKAGWTGVAGMQGSNSRFAVSGAEGFIPETNIEELGLFVMETLDLGDWTYEAGMRLQHTAFAPESGCDQRDLSWSASAAAIWHFSETTNTSISLSRAQRSAGVEERYSNLGSNACALRDEHDWQVHSSTGLVELGNPNLAEETSQNIELMLHKHLGELHGQVSLFMNRVDNFIYLHPRAGEDHVAQYQQQDAEFYGYEAEMNWPLKIGPSRTVEFTVFSDFVFAELSSGAYLPRTPPPRAGFAVNLQEGHWTLGVRATHLASAEHLAQGETPTDEYAMVDLHADYHWAWGERELLAFVRVSNLLDEEVRSHTSFLKDIAPEAGRGFTLGTSYRF